MSEANQSSKRRRQLWRWIRRVAAVLAVLALAAALFGGGALWGFLKTRASVQRMTADIGRIVAPNGIQEARYIPLNGARQWITITGQDKSAPILLFLHGGPGGALSDMSYVFQRPWEDYFTVVQWDQRGYGRSAIDLDKIRGSTTKEQYVADTISLIDYLRHRFGQRKVVLVGQSWGTLVGLEVAHRRPDLLHAYVGIGQVTNWELNFEGTRLNLLALAARTGDRKLAAEMEKAGPVPIGPDKAKKFVEFDGVVGGAMTRLGYSWHNFQGPGDSWEERMVTAYVMSPSVSDKELYNRFFNRVDTFPNYYPLHPTITGWDAERNVGTDLKVPLITVSGRYDWQTPIDRAKTYFDKVCAPYKMWVEMPNSAHAVTAEEPGRMIVALVQDVLPAVQGKVPPGAQTCTPRKGR